MNDTLSEHQQWMRAPEGEHLEFKEAKQNFHFEKLLKYCAALANEGGGRIILGVTDKRPRRVVGSTAFADFSRTKAGLIERLHLRIEGEELAPMTPDMLKRIFEYRSTEVPGPANQRDEYRQGFLLFYDKLWDTVDLRNDLQHYQEGFVMHPVRTFSESRGASKSSAQVASRPA